MPDINLTQDARSTDPKKRRQKRSSLEYTNPGKEKKFQDERKAPGSTSMWFKSLFRKTPPGEKADMSMPASLTPPPSTSRLPEDDVEDIFANVNVPVADRVRARVQSAPQPTPLASKPSLKQLPEQEKKKPEEPYDSESVNLLPEEFSTKVDFRGRGAMLGIAIGITVVFVALMYAGLLIYENSIVTRTRTATETRQAIEGEIAALDSQQTASLAFEDRLKLVQAMLNQHVYWTKFFRLLETYTVDDVYFNGSIRLTTPGKYILAATGKDYTSIAKQLMAFRQAITNKEFISAVEITDAAQTQDADGVTTTTFSVTLTLLPNVNTYTPAEFEAIPDAVSTETLPAGDESTPPSSDDLLPSL